MTTTAPTTPVGTTVAPTSAPPTTVAPTTAVPTTAAPTTPPATEAPVGGVRDASDFDLTYDGERYPLNITLELGGEFPSISIDDGSLEVTLSINGKLVIGEIFGEGNLEVELEIGGEIIVEDKRCNFIKWSKIGELDFTIDESQVAGERPLDWKGCIYSILKLDNKAVAYGENGVTVLTPVDIKWGMQTIHHIGLVSKQAVAGTENEHYFIDLQNRLYKVSGEGLQKLDYSEYLANLTSPVLSIDIEKNLLYICDETYGYIYNMLDGSLGEGPVNITGLGTRDGILYIVSSDDIEVPKFEVCTDIYDLGTRKQKTIRLIELGTNLWDKLQVQVEYRNSNREDFKPSKWALVNPSGIAYIRCYGTEFRFRVRSFELEQFELDYVKIEGTVHEFTYLDTLTAYKRNE